MRKFTAIYGHFDSGDLREVGAFPIRSGSVEEATAESEKELAVQKGRENHQILAIVRGHLDVFDNDGIALLRTEEPDPEAEHFVNHLLKMEDLGSVYFESAPSSEVISIRDESNDNILYRVDLAASTLREELGHGAFKPLQEPITIGQYAEDIRDRFQSSS